MGVSSAAVRSIITTVMELAPLSIRRAMASVQKDCSIVMVSVVMNGIMSAMVRALQNICPAMENVLRVWLIAVVIVKLNHLSTSIVMIAMEHSPLSITPVMENVLRIWLNAMDIVKLNQMLTSIVMIAMERLPLSITPAMENVLRDMLSAMDGVSLKILWTHTIGIVEANVLRSMNSVMEHALKEEPSVETTCVSAMMPTIPTAGDTAACTTETVMVPVPVRGILVTTKHATLVTPSANTSMTMIKMGILMITMTTTMIFV